MHLKHVPLLVLCSLLTGFGGCDPPPQSPFLTAKITKVMISRSDSVVVDADFTGPPNTSAITGAARSGSELRHIPKVPITFDGNGKASQRFVILDANPGDKIAVGVTNDNFNHLSTDTAVAR